GSAVQMVLPNRPTQAELTTYFNSIRARVKGNIVFYGEPARVPVNINPPPKRIPDETAKRNVNPYAEPVRPQIQAPPPPEPKPDALPFQEVTTQVNQFLLDAGAAVRVNDAGREHGQIRAFSNSTYDVAKVVPTVVMRNEDFGRIVRLVQSGREVRLEFDIRNQVYPEGATAYNTVAEIVGTDKADEVIMMGGHLDSWHAATGATDNATGCAVMMEAARILLALGVKPRRTIRVALWSGEEQGLLGSRAYVEQHFGTAENPKPAWSKFGGYFNHDTGTGRIRAMTVFGPPEAATVLRNAVGPFSFMGIEGAIATRSRGLGGSDHTSFNAAGLPGIGTTLDPIEYGTHTWHTNLDTFERLIEADLQQGAIVIAAAVYQLAMRDELLPRFPPAQMPAAPPLRPN
nr:M20/M25/M40 family metallo-hydrolase [Blastocatellia bacterium]